MIYLDNSATTYPKPEEVYKALDNANRNLAFNAGRGSYKVAHDVALMITETKQMLADLLKTDGSHVSFESSATEAMNLIINGLGLSEGDTVYVSPFEHNAVVRPLFYLKESKGIQIEVLPFDPITWAYDKDKATDMFALKKPKAIFLSHISNVTGYILPFEDIFTHGKEYNSVCILDCSQSLGVLNPKCKNVDFVVFAGHKSLYASFGIAGFVNLTNVKLEISKSGGTGSNSLDHHMPDNGAGRYESGSQNSVAIAGLHASLKWLKETDVFEHEKTLTNYALSELKKLKKVHTYIPEDADEKILGIISISVDGYQSSDVGSILSEEYDICVRTGYHCSPFVHEFIGSLDTLGTVRISFGAFSSKSDIDSLCEALNTF